MPVTMLHSGEKAAIKKVGGKDETKRFLESMGFIAGEEVAVISADRGDVILWVKGARVAVSQGLANKIMV